jgi:hypothetical protein
MWQFSSSAFDRKEVAFDRSRALRLCQGSVLARRRALCSHAEARCSHAGARCARTQKRCARTQKRCARTQMRERPGRGSSAFDRKNCVRPHCRCLIFQTLWQKAKLNLKIYKNELKPKINYKQNVQCRK